MLGYWPSPSPRQVPSRKLTGVRAGFSSVAIVDSMLGAENALEHLRLICRKSSSVDLSHSQSDLPLVGAVPSAYFLRISPFVSRATVFTSSLPTQYCSVPSVSRTSQAPCAPVAMRPA